MSVFENQPHCDIKILDLTIEMGGWYSKWASGISEFNYQERLTFCAGASYQRVFVCLCESGLLCVIVGF